jgi:hypothetical protein
MILRLLAHDGYRRLVWLALILTFGLITGCQNTDGGGGGY